MYLTGKCTPAFKIKQLREVAICALQMILKGLLFDTMPYLLLNFFRILFLAARFLFETSFFKFCSSEFCWY